MAEHGYTKTSRRLLEARRGQVGLLHRGDHSVDAVAQPLDETQVAEHLHDHLVAAEPFTDQVFQRDMPGQPAGAVDLHSVAEHQQPDAIAAHAVVAVCDRVDHRLTRDGQRIFGHLLACEASNAHSPAHVGRDESFGAPDLLRQRPMDILTNEFVTHGWPGITHRHDLSCGKKLLRQASEKKHPGIRRYKLALRGRFDTAAGQQCL